MIHIFQEEELNTKNAHATDLPVICEPIDLDVDHECEFLPSEYTLMTKIVHEGKKNSIENNPFVETKIQHLLEGKNYINEPKISIKSSKGINTRNGEKKPSTISKININNFNKSESIDSSENLSHNNVKVIPNIKLKSEDHSLKINSAKKINTSETEKFEELETENHLTRNYTFLL